MTSLFVKPVGTPTALAPFSLTLCFNCPCVEEFTSMLSTHDLVLAIAKDLGVTDTPRNPASVRFGVRAASPGNVTLTLSWDTPPVGDTAASYRVTLTKPDSTVFSVDAFPAPAVTFSKELPDDTGTWLASVVALNSVGGEGDPATVPFVPRVTPPPPPPPPPPAKPATPGNLQAAVNP